MELLDGDLLAAVQGIGLPAGVAADLTWQLQCIAVARATAEESRIDAYLERGGRPAVHFRGTYGVNRPGRAS